MTLWPINAGWELRPIHPDVLTISHVLLAYPCDVLEYQSDRNTRDIVPYVIIICDTKDITFCGTSRLFVSNSHKLPIEQNEIKIPYRNRSSIVRRSTIILPQDVPQTVQLQTASRFTERQRGGGGGGGIGGGSNCRN